MKNTFKVIALAFAVSALATACNNKPAEVIDTIAEDTVIVEDTLTVDTLAEDTVVVEQPVATKPAKKAATKKIEDKTVTLAGGETAITTKTGKMQKASGTLDNETSKTTKEGTTISTNNAGKMKRATN